MTESALQVGHYTIPLYSLNTLVVGSGAAGFNAADRLYRFGQHDVAIVTEHVAAGTSRNTGSDKQTYYKLTLSGSESDSVRAMAQNLFEGQCVDGDIALCEAALSCQCFMHLVELGVPFPRNRYGEFTGYKTDHDVHQRATSVGPYTSRMMTECLEKSVMEKGIRIFDNLLVVRIFVLGGQVKGVLCLDVSGTSSPHFVAFNCTNVIYATGGPAGMYADSVYPAGQYGATGIALEAGVSGRNLTEWQYGLASVKPRWNVSGTYMQVLPRFFSTGPAGDDERDFLTDYFRNTGELLSMVFLKGYQWPFDIRKAAGGSSLIDLLVYRETSLGRRVFLDFRENPGKTAVDFSLLSPEAYAYLNSAGACFGTPVQRLQHMNAPAMEFYRSRGIDLATQPLEIALSAQHNNGGLGVDCWWQTNISGFFAVGEAGATHGVYRPGGSALNSGQVGSLRAAQYIAACRTGVPDTVSCFTANFSGAVESVIALSQAIESDSADTVDVCWKRAAARMSRAGAAVRNVREIATAVSEIRDELDSFSTSVRTRKNNLARAFHLRDVLTAQYVYLNAMLDYVRHGGRSRGSALYTDKTGTLPCPGLPDVFRFVPDAGTLSGSVQETQYRDGQCSFIWRPVRPIPETDDFFENVWRSYRENGNIW